MLDIVAEELPLGANEWALVEKRFNDDGDDVAVMRDQDSLKKKFDKLAATKKSTGDPTCPPDVRRAKQIARDINGRAHAAMVGDSSDEEGGDLSNDGNVSHNSNVGSEALGSRKRKREQGARGVKRIRGNSEDELVVHVESMSEAVTELVKSMTSGAEADRNAIDELVGKRVSEELADTKRLINEQSTVIDELKTMLKTLLPSNRQA